MANLCFRGSWIQGSGPNDENCNTKVSMVAVVPKLAQFARVAFLRYTEELLEPSTCFAGLTPDNASESILRTRKKRTIHSLRHGSFGWLPSYKILNMTHLHHNATTMDTIGTFEGKRSGPTRV